MYKQSSHSSKYLFPRLSNDKRITTPKNNFKKFNFDINSTKLSQKNSFCKKHQEPFIKYCQNCNSDLCKYCVFTHDDNHNIIEYTDIIPDENEINLLKQTLKIFHENYIKLLDEIKKWEKNLSEKILFFEKEIENNELLNNIDFINDFSKNEINFKNIFKFRKIFNQVLGVGSSPNPGVESGKNNNIMENIDINDEIDKSEFNMSYYNYTQYNLSKALLDLLINNNINIDNSFIYKGNLIIKYIWDSYINISKLNPDKKIIKTTKPKKYDTSTYCGSLRYDKDEDVFFNNNISKNFSNKSKIIEKHIDLKKGSKKNIRRINTPLYSNNTYDINSNNNNNIFNRTMSTSFSSKNLLNNNLGNSGGIYLKKKCNLSSANIINNWNNKLNQTDYDISKQLNIDNYDENTKLNDSGINSDFTNKKIKTFGRTRSFNYVNKNSFNTQKLINKNMNINSDNQKDIITSKYIPEIRVRNLIYNKNSPNMNLSNKYNTENFSNTINSNPNKGKIFSHKKLEPTLDNNNNIYNQNEKEEENKLNQTLQYNKLNETSIQDDTLNNSNILNTTYSQYHTNNDFSIKKNIIISQKKETNINIQFISNNNPQNILDKNSIKSTLFNHESNKNLINPNPSSQKIQIRKCNPDTKYIINPNVPLCLSIELDNDDCKLCLINQLNQEIDIFSFSQEQYSIPMILSFNEKNEILIGNEADQLSTINPTKTIFNLMKLIGKKYDEILGMKEIWPNKIYKDEKNRPFFWINFGKSDKKFYAEDLLSIYLKKLFNIFFKKISCEKYDENNDIIDINIILVVCVPNNFTYIQRKIIEKIFQKQIFPSNQENNIINNNNIFINNSTNEIKLYNNYHIILKNIKIENTSSIAALCLKPIENKSKNKVKPTYSLIISIGGTHTNISIVYYPSYKTNNSKSSSKNKFFGIKATKGIELGAMDYTDTFVSDCLKEFDKNLYRQCLESPNALAKLRRSCNTAEKIFGENSHVEIKVNKLYDTYDLKMILNKSDYEKVCDDLYKNIITEIKKTIKEAKLSEINIDHILLIGNIARCDKIKNLLKNLFKHNRSIFNKLSDKANISETNNDFYTVIGGAIQARNYLREIDNINMDEDLSLLNDITPMSFGVETINGMMEFVVEKGTSLPVEKNKYIKIKNDGEKCLEIKIYEGEDNKVCNNKLISSANIDKRNFKFEKVGNNYIEILLQFAISSDLNLYVYVLDIKTMKKRFECLINIDLKKS